ncbi:nucleoside-diphosphate-sugar epimerase [Catenuloplanes nepalensis]|uniref:Nucleoside-diphosphate-sugar epimerase n=1 Tax=Catenuloplanes nepalensis TaxID=587533 RepID=A0ABT9MTU6_9ACTN|nr:NmrA family NAD(P)-binding protein [Catenuloplanes nepalensis]MDP9794876.1 nucleoside-diphosphate-sugar epimerase [Catenuloplanes nepalensis]
MTVVLVAGATGSLGSLIVKNLLERGATVRALVRPSSADGGTRLRDVAGHPRLSLRVGDLTDGAAALAPHLESVEVVVSAVQGGPEVIIDGQTELLRAAERAGVHRMIPSDFSINLWGYGYGVNILSDLRRTFAEAFRTSPVARTSVAIGAFPEYFLGPFHEVLDPAAGTFSIWGDGTRKIDITTIPDAAAFTAAIALDPMTAGRDVHVVGRQLSLLELRNEVEAATGRRWALVRKGSLDDLQTEIVRRQFAATNPFAYVALQYQTGMYGGSASLTDVRNADYPDVVPASVAEYLAGPGAAHFAVPESAVDRDDWPATV